MVGNLSLANGYVRKIERRGTECKVHSVVGVYIGVMEPKEKRKEVKVFLDAFTTDPGVF